MEQPLKIGICADVHHDLIPDGIPRLTAFIDEMNREKPDFIIQLGDFCRPYEYNLPFMDVWNSFNGPRYHVIGNHDNDGGFGCEGVLKYWKSPDKYYSFDIRGYHFIVLYGSDTRPEVEVKGYPRCIGHEQQHWLADDIDRTNLPVILFIHQGIDIDTDEENGSIKEGIYIRRILERANEKAGFQKVRLFLSGHYHRDYCNNYNGIFYAQINSMSYQWLGQKYPCERFDKSVYEKYPWYKFMAPHKDPLWALITIDSNGEINIHGRRSEWVGPSPADMGIGIWDEPYPAVPYISDRKLVIPGPVFRGKQPGNIRKDL
jgi:calcineurin-like phosphoesterase family protein